MINRSFVAAALASVALLTASVTLAGSTAEAAKRKKKPSIGRATLSPSRLPGSGGTVNVRVLIKPNNATISSVTASSTMGGGSPSAAATLSSTDGQYYNGTLRVDRNPRKKATSANIFVELESSNGRVRKKVGRVRLDGGGTVDDGAPPPPPDI